MSPHRAGGTAIVLGGGGVLGAVQVGMLRALLDLGIRPDLVVGTSIGALNGAVLAALSPDEVADRLEVLWAGPAAKDLFAGGTARLRIQPSGRAAMNEAQGQASRSGPVPRPDPCP
jgi:predicted acylesterase/phospholipase RssA